MENPDLRLSQGMKPDQKGVRIRRIDPTAPESNVLNPSDIILSFDRVDIANDGTGNTFNCVILLLNLKNNFVQNAFGASRITYMLKYHMILYPLYLYSSYFCFTIFIVYILVCFM